MKVGTMKVVIAILFMILAAAAFLQAEAASSKSDSIGSVFFTPGTDAKKMEDKMAEALASLDSWKRARAEEEREPFVSKNEKAELPSSPPINSTLNDSTLNNISINSSLSNSSLLNSSAAMVTNANKDRLNVGSSSMGIFSGYYGMIASRHEMGKSGIDSSMFLRGTFEMDKTVKFQDKGI